MKLEERNEFEFPSQKMHRFKPQTMPDAHITMQKQWQPEKARDSVSSSKVINVKIITSILK